MKRGMTPAVFVSVGLLLGQVAYGSVASADDQTTPVAAPLGPSVVAGDSPYAYVGSGKCKKCHLPAHRSWASTKMGKAFETLKPGNAAEAKTKHGLDPQKDYTTDPKCLKCHTTGFGHEGGYAIPDPNDKKAVRKAKKLANCGCESCHGPGSEYIKIFNEIFKSKGKYGRQELYSAGMNKMDESACVTCHNEEGPTYDASKPFNYVEMKEKDRHDPTVLKQRQD